MATWLSHPLLRRKLAGVDQNITFVTAKMLSREKQDVLEAETGMVVHPEVSDRMVYGIEGGFPTGLEKIPADTTLNFDAFHEQYPANPLERLGAAVCQQAAPIQNLPVEIILKIFGTLDLSSLDCARFACKSWYALIMTDELLLHRQVCLSRPILTKNLRAHAKCFEKQAWRYSNGQTPKMRQRQCDIIFTCPEADQKTILVAITNSCTLLAMVTEGKTGYTLLVYHLDHSGRPCLVKGVALKAKPSELSIKNSPASQFGSTVIVSYGKKAEQFEVVQRLTVRRIDHQRTSVFDLYRSTHTPVTKVAQTRDGDMEDWTIIKRLNLESVMVETQSAFKKRPYRIARHRNGRLYFAQLNYDPTPWIKPLVLISCPYADAEIVNVSVEPHQGVIGRHFRVVIIWRGQTSPLSTPRNVLFVYEIEFPRSLDGNAPQSGSLTPFSDGWKIDLDGKFVGQLPHAPEKLNIYANKKKTAEDFIRCGIAYGYRLGILPTGLGGQWKSSTDEIPKREEREKVDLQTYDRESKVDGSFSEFANEEQTTSGTRLFCTGSHVALWGLTNDGGLRLRFIQLIPLNAHRAYNPRWDLGHESNCGCRLHDYGWLVVNPVLQHPFPLVASNGFFSKANSHSIPDAKIKAEEVQYLVSRDRHAAIKRVEAAVLAQAVKKAARMAYIRDDHIEGKAQEVSVVPPSLLTLQSRSILRDTSLLNARREFRRVYEAITGNSRSTV